MTTAIFDLDGCLSDDRPRHHLLPPHRDGGGDAAYVAYHARLHEDKPINTDVLAAHRALGHDILFVTARPEAVRDTTREWIERHLDAGYYGLVMRPDDDPRRSPELKVAMLGGINWARVVAAYDDREDVLAAYKAAGCRRCVRLFAPRHAGDVLAEMAETFAARNAVYKDNYRNVAAVIAALFPCGVPSNLVTTPHWHLFELIVVKMTRFANSNLAHPDSIHDVGVYSAMIKAELEVR